MFDHSECYGTAGCHGWLETIRPDGNGRSTLARLDELYNLYEPDWQALPGPQRSDYKNASHYCKALHEFLGDEVFRARFGGAANAHGKCVSANHS